MKPFRLAILPAVFTFFTACNSGDKTAQPPLTDSLTINDSLAKRIQKDTVAAEPAKYTDRVINLPRAEWPALQSRDRLKDAPVTNTIKGDFNGDGKPETVYLVAPVEDSTKGEGAQECYGGCNSYLVSSDAALPVLIVHDNLGGEIKNIGDMDGDGADDLLVYPAWWQSNWNPYRLYSMKKESGEWRYLTEPVSIFAPDLYSFKKPLVKRSSKPGFVTAFTSETNDEGDTKSRYADFPFIK